MYEEVIKDNIHYDIIIQDIADQDMLDKSLTLSLKQSTPEEIQSVLQGRLPVRACEKQIYET